MSKRLFKIICIVLTLIMALSLAACGAKSETTEPSSSITPVATEAPAEEVKISGNILWSSNRTDFQNTLMPEYVKEFNEKYPDVKVSLETYKDYKEAIKIKMASGDMPAVFAFGPGDYTKDQVQANAVALDDLQIVSDFVALDPYKGNDGKLYALPTGTTVGGIVYNKKLFKELGIEIPQTLDEFVAAGKKITDSGKVGLATAAKGKWVLQYYFRTGEITKAIANDVDANNKLAAIDEPFTPDSAAVKSWSILKRFADEKIIEKDALSADWEPMKKEFRAGNVGMFYLGNWFGPQAVGDALTDADIGFFPFPYDNVKGPHVAVAGGDVAWAMGRDSKSPEAQKAFFEFLTDTKYADYAARTGMFSARKSITIESPLSKEFNSFSPTYIYSTGDSKELNDVVSKAQFDADAFAQLVIATKDFNKLIADLNAKWKKARGN